MSEARSAAGAARLPRAAAVGWVALAALAAIGWREGLAFALSNGGAPDMEHLLFEAADNPPWLVTLIAAALLVSRRGDLRRAIGAPGSPLRAAALLAPGLALVVWARLTGAGDLALLGAVAMALGSALALAGGRFARLVALPLILLVFAAPIPGALVNQVVWPLQLLTADYAHWLLQQLGVTVLHLGDVLRTSRHNFLVIEGCSGLGSIEVLTLLALAWAWQTGASLRHGLALVAAAPIIAFVLNGFRVVSLVLFPDSQVWSVHTTQGIVTFAIGALCIALLDRWLDGRLDAPAPAEATGAHASAGSAAPRPPAAVFAWLAAAALATVALPPFAQRGEVIGPALLPETLAGFRDPETLEPDRLFLGSVRFSRSDYRSYEPDPARAGTGRVAIFVGEDAWRHRSFSVRSPKTSYPGRGFVVEERAEVDLVHGYRAERLVLRGERSRTLAVRFYVGVEGATREALRAFLALERSPFARPGHGFVVRNSTELERGPQGVARAERRLRDAVRGLDLHLERLAAWKAPQRG
ncbi:MAG TPA: exosortase/archaeosortase family protein [Myxococcota bacterium]|nr:exosortase/archaeosortase family protein [Myxococcota bacterium]